LACCNSSRLGTDAAEAALAGCSRLPHTGQGLPSCRWAASSPACPSSHCASSRSAFSPGRLGPLRFEPLRVLQPDRQLAELLQQPVLFAHPIAPLHQVRQLGRFRFDRPDPLRQLASRFAQLSKLPVRRLDCGQEPLFLRRKALHLPAVVLQRPDGRLEVRKPLQRPLRLRPLRLPRFLARVPLLRLLRGPLRLRQLLPLAFQSASPCGQFRLRLGGLLLVRGDAARFFRPAQLKLALRRCLLAALEFRKPPLFGFPFGKPPVQRERFPQPRLLRLPGLQQLLPPQPDVRGQLFVINALLLESVHHLRRTVNVLPQRCGQIALFAKRQDVLRLRQDVVQAFLKRPDFVLQIALHPVKALFHPLVQPRPENPAHNLLFVVRIRGQQLAEFALRQHHDLAELVFIQADDRFQLRVDVGHHKAVDAGHFLARRRLVQLDPAAGLVFVGSLAVRHLAEHAVRAAADAKHEIDGRMRPLVGKMAAKHSRLGPVLAACAAVQGVANRIENRRLARARIAGNDEQTAILQQREIDRLLVPVRPESRHRKPDRPHAVSPSSASCTAAVSVSANSRFLSSLNGRPVTSS
jgi:hypothetical protein